MLEYQEKGTEVNTRTAALYSKQGSTDLTELMVVDEMTQCQVCREHNAEGKSFCKRGPFLQELSSEKTETLKETTAQWRKGRSQGHAGTLCQASRDYKTAKHHFGKAQKNNFECCADGWEKDADYRKCT